MNTKVSLTDLAEAGFDHIALGDEHALWHSRLPEHLVINFHKLWDLHPVDYHQVRVPTGRMVPTPRWQQTYDRDYQYTGSRNNALPLPVPLRPLLEWSRKLDPRLNGAVINWYDAALGHYIGKHRDSTIGLVSSAPIVTISLGECGKFRVRPVKGKGFQDFPMPNGTVFVLPFSTNKAWKHEVPKLKSNRGRRISVTFRAFQD